MRDKEVDLSLREHLAPDIYDSICLNVKSMFISIFIGRLMHLIV